MNKMFKCEDCNIPFTSSKHLKRHIKNQHNRDCIFKCLTCGKEIQYKDNMKRHVENQHGIDQVKENIHFTEGKYIYEFVPLSTAAQVSKHFVYHVNSNSNSYFFLYVSQTWKNEPTLQKTPLNAIQESIPQPAPIVESKTIVPKRTILKAVRPSVSKVNRISIDIRW